MGLFKKKRGWRNYHRNTIPLDRVGDYCQLADQQGDGHIFHHIYINAKGEKCYHLSKENSSCDPKLWTACGGRVIIDEGGKYGN